MMQTLIVCEKPDAAARVARALDEDGDPRRIETQGVTVYESRNKHETIVICSAIGHLYAVDSKTRTSRRYYPVWDFDWKPKHLIDKKSARLARWIQVISSLANKADRFINACDYDVEGSLIGYTILRYACQGADSKAQRMKFSTMTEKELRSAYKTLAPQLDMPLVEAGRTRHPAPNTICPQTEPRLLHSLYRQSPRPDPEVRRRQRRRDPMLYPDTVLDN